LFVRARELIAIRPIGTAKHGMHSAWIGEHHFNSLGVLHTVPK
jgi:hypothetical protein